MNEPGYYVLMAHYNRWANDAVYALCATIPDDVRRKDCGVFFRSIHGTLNHLYHGDEMWWERFHGLPRAHAAFGVDIFDDFDELRAAHSEIGERIEKWVTALTPAELAADMTFTAASVPRSLTQPMWVFVTHLFNHQTHHRGQLSALIQQAGYEMPSIDLPWSTAAAG